jgi:FAD:protein FMN transferase
MATASSRTVHVEPVMGTVVSFDVRDDAPAAAAVGAACAWLHEVDRAFSTHRDDSTISRLDRGELLVADAGEHIQHVLTACAELHRQTGGAFDVRAAGRLDPSAYVKGWAAQRAAVILESHGLRHFQINAGGDVVVRGDAGPPGQGWRIGIRHPRQPGNLAAVARLRDTSIATSALYERGNHIVDAADDGPQAGSTSVTVVADDLGWADGWATALFAAGAGRLALLEAHPEIEAILIVGDTATVTPGFPTA